MRKIKRYKIIRTNYIYKKLLNTEEEKTELQEKQEKSGECFALVVVRERPWYIRLFRSIRNFIVIYKWRKAW